MCCEFDSMAHFLKEASAFGFKPSSPWRAVLWVLVLIVWDKGSEIPTTATLGPELSELSQGSLDVSWSHVLWVTCFVPRASLVISRLEYTLFKTQQVAKSIYDLKRWHKHHLFLGLHNDHQESSKPLKCMCHFSPLVTISRSLFAHF